MFDVFPRELAMPKRRLVQTKREFLELINKNNCKNNIYTTLYTFKDVKIGKFRDEPIYETAVIDKVFFDLDSETCYDDMLKLHKEFDKDNLKHAITFSGKGFHVYLFIKFDKKELENPKDTVTRVQKHFIDKLKLEVDEHIIGDTARITRVPNTFNLRRRRYCIPLERKDLNLTYEEIKQKAVKQNKISNFIMGVKLFDVSGFDVKINYQPLDIDIPELDIKNSKIDLKKLNMPPCIKLMLNQPHPIWRDRGFILIFFRDKGLLPKEIQQIVENFWEPEVIEHALTSPRGDKQLYYIFRDYGRYLFPGCDRLINLNLCPKKCKEYPFAIYLK